MKFSVKFLLGLSVLFLFFLAGMGWIGWQSYEKLYETKVSKLKDLVDTTIGLLTECDQKIKNEELSLEDAMKEAANRIRNIRYSGEEYFWINDLHPKMVMHPYKSELEGKDLSDMKDPRGKKLFVEFVEICRNKGEGYSQYMWPKHQGSQPVPKISYVKLFEPWKWIVGTGVYLDDLEEFKRVYCTPFVKTLFHDGNPLLSA